MYKPIISVAIADRNDQFNFSEVTLLFCNILKSAIVCTSL